MSWGDLFVAAVLHTTPSQSLVGILVLFVASALVLLSGALGLLLNPLGPFWGALGTALAFLGVPLGCPWAPLGAPWNGLRLRSDLEKPKVCFQTTLHHFWQILPSAPDSPDQAAPATTRDLPSTRTWGQDDVS